MSDARPAGVQFKGTAKCFSVIVFLTSEIEFVLFLAVLEYSVLPMG